MKVEGIIYAECDVNSYEAIKVLCQTAGLVSERGYLITEVIDGKVIVYKLDGRNEEYTEVLYDQPFDVEYASTLIKLYQQTKDYLNLPKETLDSITGYNGDYQIACKLKIRRKSELYYRQSILSNHL